MFNYFYFMKNRIYLFLFIFIFALQLNAQNSYYFISFKDKDTTNFSKLIPENFLSIKSIERKKKFKLPVLTINDLPVNKIHIDTIVPFVHQHLQTLKWFNGIVVLANNNLTDTLKGFKFIKDITLIGYEKDNEFFKEIDLLEKVNLLEKKFEKDEKVDSSLYYGFATNVIYFNKIQKLHQLNLKGKNIDIAVIDVGFNEVINNPYFKKSSIKQIITFSNNQNDFHGLSVLGCLAANIPYQYVGSAPEANYYLFSSENVNFEYPIEEYYWARSAEIADSIGVDLISSSLGYSEFDDKKFNHKHKDLNGNKTTIAKAANIALANGMAVVISAGNEGDNLWETITTPADVENVLTVGSCNEEKNVSRFSSIGFVKHKIVKPEITSLGQSVELINDKAKIYTGNGTSYSTPIIAGGVACLMQNNPDKSFKEIKFAISLSANNYFNPNKNIGFGVPDFELALKYLKSYSTDTILNVVQLLDSNFHISLYSTTKQKVEITLLSIDNKIVLKHNEKIGINYNRFRLNKSNKLKRGLYILKIKTANTVLFQKVEKF